MPNSVVSAWSRCESTNACAAAWLEARVVRGWAGLVLMAIKVRTVDASSAVRQRIKDKHLEGI